MEDFADNLFNCEDDSVLYFVKRIDEPWIGLTILSSKALKKRKGWEHILLEKETLLGLKEYLKFPPYKKIGYFECRCTAELLRVVHEDDCFYIDIFDNGALKLKSGIKTSTFIKEEDAPELIKVINTMLNFLD